MLHSYISYINRFRAVSNSLKEPITVDSSVKLSVGYIAHLCKVGEILETILLTQHNLDQMEKFVDFVQAENDLDAIEKLLSNEFQSSAVKLRPGSGRMSSTFIGTDENRDIGQLIQLREIQNFSKT